MLDIGKKEKHLGVPSDGHKISSTATEISSTSTAGPLGVSTYTIDGDRVFSSTQSNDKALYEIDNKIDGSYKGHVISLVRVDREIITENGNDRVKTRKKHIYDVTRSPFWPHEFRIDGMRKDSYKKSYLRGNAAPGGGVGISGSDVPLLSARPPVSSLVRFKGSGTLQWRDEKGEVIAIETERAWTEKEGEPVREETKPKLELKLELDDKLLDFLMVAWCARNWKEARAATDESMTWEDCKLLGPDPRYLTDP